MTLRERRLLAGGSSNNPRTKTDTNDSAFFFEHSDEWWLHLHIVSFQGKHHGSDTCVWKVPRLQKENPGKLLTSLHRELTEIAIVGHDDPSLPVGLAEYLGIVSASKIAIKNGTDVLAARGKISDNLRMDVLIRKQREFKDLHAEIFTSQTTSLFTASAAWRRAAANPSAER